MDIPLECGCFTCSNNQDPPSGLELIDFFSLLIEKLSFLN
jgi:hypothetical protein